MSNHVTTAPRVKRHRVQRWLAAMGEILALVPVHKRVIVVAGLFISGLLELVGMTMIIPLLATASSAREAKGLSLAIETAFNALGLPFEPRTLLVMIIVGLSLKAMVGILVARYVAQLVGNIGRDFQIRLTRGILATRWSFFIGQPLGRLVQASGPETAAIGECFELVTAVIATAMTAALFLTIAALLSWKLLVLILVITTFMFLSFGRLVQSGRAAAKHHRQHMRQHAAQFTDAMIGFKQIRAMGRTDRFAYLFEKDARALARSLRSRVLSGDYAVQIQEPVIGGMLAMGFFFALHTMQSSLSDVIIMALLLVRTIAILAPVQRQFQRLLQSHDLYTSLVALCAQLEGAAESWRGTKAPHFQRSITLSEVAFGYAHPLLLRDLTLEIPAGTITAVSGPSGIGKSTIVDLIVGLHRPTSGTVRVDEDELEALDINQWRRMVGYVPQEVTLFHESIFNNVALWAEEVTPADVEEALRAAGAWSFVSERKAGMKAVVGERGHRLSGGQRQRISIARALLHKPRLLILDEATTGLDPVTERQICDRVAALCREQGLAVLAVSHQPAWQAIADRVYQIRDGRAVLQRGRSGEIAVA